MFAVPYAQGYAWQICQVMAERCKMLVQREVHDTMLAGVLQNIDEMELAKALESYIEESKSKLLKAGKRRPFKPFKAIRMKGEGPTASQMVVGDRF